MNTIFVLVIFTSTGIVETPRPFHTMEECVQMQKSIQFDSFCSERNITEKEKKSFWISLKS